MTSDLRELSKSMLNSANYLADGRYRVQASDIKFRSQVRLSLLKSCKECVQIRDLVGHCNTPYFFGSKRFSPPSALQAGAPSLLA
jgi:hypothetical protein